MTKIEWFDILVELDAATRLQKIVDLQVSDANLAAELKRLLAQDALDANVEDAASTRMGKQLNLAITTTVQARTQIGNYQLLGLLGQGGMGEVWRAERDLAGSKQLLAIKLLKLEDMTPELKERFALEQRTLLKLVHPNIARLLDAGVANDGRPWIAMELVDGTSITQYCDQHKLSIPARLTLFRQVIAAVQYAHDHLIVHRDIKPDNVLVDQSGQVKLLDFGIAKNIDRTTPNTLTQQRFFSLYATAPEQLLGSSVCVGTDVYALGGLLYELLSGAPLISQDIKTPAQLQAFIVEKTPTLPSRIATAAAANNRSFAQSQQLRASLSGDLDRIVLHALRKLPSERYASARAFDEDILAFQEHRPVQATGQGKGYRAKKFLRRHWLATSVSGLALAGLLALTVLLALRGNQLQRANTVAVEQQKRAEAAKANADEARVAAESVNSFLIDVFKRADPLARERGDKGLGVVIDASFAEIKARQKFDRSTAPLLIAVVRGLVSLGKTDKAGLVNSLMRLNLEIRARELVSARLARPELDAIDRPFLLTALGRIARVTEDREQEALNYTLAYNAASGLFGSDSTTLLSYRNDYAVGLMRTGHFEEAEAEYNSIVAIARKLFKANDARFNYLAFNIAVCWAKRGALTESGRARLNAAAVRDLDEIPLFAIVALARNDYLNSRIDQFKLRIKALAPMLKPEQIKPELALWIALANGEKSTAPRLQALIKTVSEYDPKIKETFQ